MNMNKQFTKLITSLGLLTMLCFLGVESKAQTLVGETQVCSENTEEYVTDGGRTNYVWSYSGGVEGTDFKIKSGGTATSNTVQIEWITVGSSYSISVIYDGIENSISLPIEVRPLPVVGFSYFQGDNEITSAVCHNTEIKIVASSNGDNDTYKWALNSEDGQELIVLPQNTTSGNITESYQIQVINGTTGCIKYAAAQVNVHPIPAVSITVTPESKNICSGESVVLNAHASNVSYVWSHASETTNEITVSNLTNTGAEPLQVTYTVTVTDNTAHCTNTASAAITVNPLPAAGTITGDADVCVGKELQLSHATTGGEWKSNHPSVATVNGNGLVTGVTSGTAEIEHIITSSAGCKNSAKKTITVHAAPSAGTITGDANACIDETIQLTSDVTGGQWLSSDNNIATVSTQGLVTAKTTGTVEIRYVVTNSNDCEGIAKHTIVVKESTTLTLADKTTTYDRNPNSVDPIHVNYQGQAVGDLAWVEYEYYEQTNVRMTTMPVDAGVYTVIAKFGGNNEYCPAANSTATLTVNRANISVATVDNIESQFYTGSAITPAVVVKHGTAVLEEDTEYTVRYANNVNAGDAAEIILAGVGNYTGETTVYFSIIEETELQRAIREGQDIVDNHEDEYSPGSIEKLEDAISKGMDVINNPNSTQEEINEATQAIRDAINGLLECIPFENVVITRWDNTLTVINNPGENGNYKFKDGSYQWYRKTAEENVFSRINGATDQYYSVGPKATDLLKSTDQYYVTMVTTAGAEASSCAGYASLKQSAKAVESMIVTYPNPVNPSGLLYIDLSNENPEDLNNAVIEIYSTTGVIVSSTNVTGTVVEIDMPDNAGIYLVRVRAQNIEYVEKVIVK